MPKPENLTELSRHLKNEVIPPWQHHLRELFKKACGKYPLLGAIEAQFQTPFTHMPQEALVAISSYNEQPVKFPQSAFEGDPLFRIYESADSIRAGQPHIRQVSFSAFGEPDFRLAFHSGHLKKGGVIAAITVNKQDNGDQELSSISVCREWPYTASAILIARPIILDSTQLAWDIFDPVLSSNTGACGGGYPYRKPTNSEAKLVTLKESEGFVVISATDQFPEATGFSFKVPVKNIKRMSSCEIRRRETEIQALRYVYKLPLSGYRFNREAYFNSLKVNRPA